MIKCVKCKYSHNVVMKNRRFVFICETGLESDSSDVMELTKKCERFVPFGH